MNDVGPKDLRRWSEEVARDPGSPAFVPLADAYRRQGRREAAVRVCVRGLERNPEHVDAHSLLARLYLESGERSRAADEWGIVLRLDPESFEANRGLGFYRLERGELDAARGHLERAARARPDDPTVREALAVVDRRGKPGVAAPIRAAKSAATGEGPDAAAVAREAAYPATASPADGSRDPANLFAPLGDDAPFRGAVLIDRQGLTLAGSLEWGGSGRAEAVGALFTDAIEEAARAAGVLGLGDWTGLSLELDDARLHIGALGDGHAIVLATTPNAPAGWIVRSAGRARALATAFLEGGS